MMSTSLKLLLGVTLILAEVVAVAQGSNVLTGFWDKGPSFNEPVLLIFPLVFTIVYAVLSRNTMSAFIFGVLSWMIFPIVVFLMYRSPPSEAILMVLLAIGLFYGLVGAISSVKMTELWDFRPTS
jgi:hypothetical protein